MRRPRLTYANVTATLALVISLGGVSYAATQLPANSVKAVQIAPSAVGPSELRTSAVHPSQISQALATRLQEAVAPAATSPKEAVAPGSQFVPPRGENACAVFGKGFAECLNVPSSTYNLGLLQSHTTKITCPPAYEIAPGGENGPGWGPPWVIGTKSPHYSGAAIENPLKPPTLGYFTFTNWSTHKYAFTAYMPCVPLSR
jgi:hypothetical protein